MREYLKKLPQEIQDLTRLASDVACQNNMQVYLVGGFVRDLILGVKNLDLDIVVEGDGIKFSEDFALALKARFIRHRRFGTATLVVKPGLKIDIATARKEFYPQPASLPVVTPGTLRDDLRRRDFTINAMAISISRQDYGRFIDSFGGSSDLRHKKVRVLHDLSFIDDPTRILRAIRFEKRYNFRIESETINYLKGAIRLKMLEKVQPQRLRDELILVLKEAQALRQIRRIQELAGFGFISPYLRLLKNSCNLLSVIERQIRWFQKSYARHRQLDTWLIYFMGLMDSLNINAVKSVCKKYVFSKGEEKRILTYKKAGPGVILALSRNKIRPSEIFSLLEPLSYEVILLLKAKSRNRYVDRHIEDFFAIYNGVRILVTGDDLRKLGVQPGPRYQKIFTRVLKEKLNGSLDTKEEELALINKLIRLG